jgi:hypothetical protein
MLSRRDFSASLYLRSVGDHGRLTLWTGSRLGWLQRARVETETIALSGITFDGLTDQFMAPLKFPLPETVAGHPERSRQTMFPLGTLSATERNP